MLIHFHPDLSPLPAWKRAAFAACAALGVVGQFFVAIAVCVEVLTAPNPSPARLWVLAPAAFSVWHVSRELSAYGRIPPGRWLLFAAAAASLSVKAWLTIADPTARLFFAGIGAGSAALVWLARLIARDALPPRDDDGPA